MCKILPLLLATACAAEAEHVPVSVECEGAMAYKLRGARSQCSAFPLQGRWVTAGHCVDDHDLVQIDGWGTVLFTRARWGSDWDYALSDPGTAPSGFLLGSSAELDPKDLVVMWGFPGGLETLRFTDFVSTYNEDLLVTTEASPGFSGGVFISGRCKAVGIISYTTSGYTGGDRLDQIPELSND